MLMWPRIDATILHKTSEPADRPSQRQAKSSPCTDDLQLQCRRVQLEGTMHCLMESSINGRLHTQVQGIHGCPPAQGRLCQAWSTSKSVVSSVDAGSRDSLGLIGFIREIVSTDGLSLATLFSESLPDANGHTDETRVGGCKGFVVRLCWGRSPATDRQLRQCRGSNKIIGGERMCEGRCSSLSERRRDGWQAGSVARLAKHRAAQ